MIEDMKKVYTISVLVISALLLFSCSPMDEVYKEYQGDGPIIYVAKVVDAVVNPGMNRAKISWAPLEDPRIKSVDISWLNGKGSASFDWDPTTPFEAVIDNLPEGSIIFTVTNRDAYGNKSVSVDVPSAIYGDGFKSLLDESTVVSGTYDSDANIITAAIKHASSVYYKGTEFVYKDIDGQTKSVLVPKGENLKITDASSDLDIKYHTVSTPEENAYEDYASDLKDWEYIKTPVFEVSASSVLLPAASGYSRTVNISANRAPITVEADADWVVCSENSGLITVKSASKNSAAEARTCNVYVKAFGGSATILAKQTPDRVGTAYGTEGVIWWQNNDEPTQYKMISAERGNCKWSIETVSTGATAESGQSTKAGARLDNNDILMAMGDATKYPAVWWCKNLGEGWYLPSGTEVKGLIEAFNGGGYTYTQLNGKKISQLNDAAKAAHDKFDKAFDSIGAHRLDEQTTQANGDWIWGSQEANTTNAYAARLGVYGYGSRSKKFDGDETTGPFFTRAMKIVTIEE